MDGLADLANHREMSCHAFVACFAFSLRSRSDVTLAKRVCRTATLRRPPSQRAAVDDLNPLNLTDAPMRLALKVDRVTRARAEPNRTRRSMPMR